MVSSIHLPASQELKPEAMSIFHPFGRLVTELRLEIWEAFLRYEIQERRLVILDWEDSVRSTLHLQCPLLSVNRESRQHARDKYYTVSLAVFRMPQDYPYDTSTISRRLQ